MSRTKRTVSRVAGVALALTGAAAFMAAGQASANDRAVVVSCTDSSAGTWTVSVTFSSHRGPRGPAGAGHPRL